MKVLHLISSEGLYGAENMLVSLASALRSLSIDTVVAAFRHRPSDPLEVLTAARAAGLETTAIPCYGRFDMQAPGRIRTRLNTHAADILHTHGYKADIYGYLATRSAQVPLVSTCHNWPDPSRLMQAYAKLDRLMLRQFDSVTTPSSRVATTLRHSGVPAWKVRVIANGVDVPRFAEAAATRQPSASGLKTIGFVGRLVNGKGGLTLLDAAQRVLAAHPEAEFHLVGEGPEHMAWQHHAAALGIAARVHFRGALTDMPAAYAAFDMLVLPSYDEAMPMCLLEGLAAGLPAIATSVGEVPRLIHHEQTGLLVEPGNAEALADAICRLLDNPSLSQRLGAEGQRLVSLQFSATAMAAQYADVYRHSHETRRAA